MDLGVKCNGKSFGAARHPPPPPPASLFSRWRTLRAFRRRGGPCRTRRAAELSTRTLKRESRAGPCRRRRCPRARGREAPSARCGWSGRTSSGRVFYQNTQTGESSWTKPDETNVVAADSSSSAVASAARSNAAAGNPLGDWIERLDPSTNRAYYQNIKTGESSWTPPQISSSNASSTAAASASTASAAVADSSSSSSLATALDPNTTALAVQSDSAKSSGWIYGKIQRPMYCQNTATGDAAESSRVLYVCSRWRRDRGVVCLHLCNGLSFCRFH